MDRRLADCAEQQSAILRADLLAGADREMEAHQHAKACIALQSVGQSRAERRRLCDPRCCHADFVLHICLSTQDAQLLAYNDERLKLKYVNVKPTM